MAGCNTITCSTPLAASFASDIVKSAGMDQFALIRKGVQIPDLNDITAYEALVASGDIILGPCGTLALGDPTDTTTTTACGDDRSLETLYELTFTTYDLNEQFEHVEWFDEMYRKRGCYNVILFDCAKGGGHPTFNSKARRIISGQEAGTLDTDPGIPFTMSAKPSRGTGDANKEIWTFTLQIRLDGNEMLGQSYFPGLLDALLAA